MLFERVHGGVTSGNVGIGSGEGCGAGHDGMGRGAGSGFGGTISGGLGRWDTGGILALGGRVGDGLEGGSGACKGRRRATVRYWPTRLGTGLTRS